MRRLWPADPYQPDDVPDAELETIYKYPDLLDGPYVRLNYSSTVNGKVALAGRSAGIGSRADKTVFGRLRRIADVILVGAGTARADHYRGARSWEALQNQRRQRGQADVAPIAVLTASADIDVEGPLFCDAWIPPMILTVRSAPSVRLAELRAAGADVIFVGDNRASVSQILGAFADRGLNRVLCEGGSSLFSELIAAEAVDEVCLTLSPNIGGSGQVSRGLPDTIRPLLLGSLLADEGVLLARYLVDRKQPS